MEANMNEVYPLLDSVPEVQTFTQAFVYEITSGGVSVDLFDMVGSKKYLEDLYNAAIDAIDKRLSKPVLGPIQAKSRDAKRLADIRQYATALELYYNDQGGYPSTPSMLVPTYFSSIPTAPTPVDGTCTASSNTYTYTPIGSSYTGATGNTTVHSSYSLSFCLGSTTGGYGPGSRTSTPEGIK
jgi:hypothetical protein